MHWTVKDRQNTSSLEVRLGGGDLKGRSAHGARVTSARKRYPEREAVASCELKTVSPLDDPPQLARLVFGELAASMKLC